MMKLKSIRLGWVNNMREYKTYEDAIEVVKRIIEMYDDKTTKMLFDDADFDQQMYDHYLNIKNDLYKTLGDLESRNR